MRTGSVLSEGWRNLLSGTTRAALFAAVLLFAVGGLAAADVRSMVAVLDGAREFRATGASIQVLDAPQGIDGARCDALAEIDGVFEVTPGLAHVLDASATAAPGVWLSADLAATLGAAPGDELATDTGETTVAGAYPYPDDGRARTLGYAVLAPSAPSGAFDACWAEVWPANPTTATYLRTALTVDAEGDNVTQGQLNPQLGTDYDAAALMAGRITRHATAGAVVVGLAIGYAAVRARRLELAGALHARVPRPSLAWQILLETIAWVAAATVIAASALWWAAAWGNPDPAGEVWAIGVRTVAAGGLGAIGGAQAALLATRERHLFRYFKNR